MLINTTTPEMATLIIEEMAKLATEDLEKGELTAFKLRLRFFGCLQGILEGDGIFPTLNDVVEKARILQENGELVCYNWIVTKEHRLTIAGNLPRTRQDRAHQPPIHHGFFSCRPEGEGSRNH